MGVAERPRHWWRYVNSSTLFLTLILISQVVSSSILVLMGHQMMQCNIRAHQGENIPQDPPSTIKPYHTKRVNIIPTKTLACGPIMECHNSLLKNERVNGDLIYNFVISPEGHVFEHLGFNRLSPISQKKPALVVGLIGHVQGKEATEEQIDQLTILGIRAELLIYLDMFKIYLRKMILLPMEIFKRVNSWTQYFSPGIPLINN